MACQYENCAVSSDLLACETCGVFFCGFHHPLHVPVHSADGVNPLGSLCPVETIAQVPDEPSTSSSSLSVEVEAPKSDIVMPGSGLLLISSCSLLFRTNLVFKFKRCIPA